MPSWMPLYYHLNFNSLSADCPHLLTWYSTSVQMCCWDSAINCAKSVFANWSYCKCYFAPKQSEVPSRLQSWWPYLYRNPSPEKWRLATPPLPPPPRAWKQINLENRMRSFKLWFPGRLKICRPAFLIGSVPADKSQRISWRSSLSRKTSGKRGHRDRSFSFRFSFFSHTQLFFLENASTDV